MYCWQNKHCLQDHNGAAHAADLSSGVKARMRAPLRDTRQTPLASEQDDEMVGLNMDSLGCAYLTE